MKLSLKQKFSFYNHLSKVMRFQHHGDLKDIFSPYIKDDAIVLDVGGHAGQFTKLFAKMAPKGKVFTFEPASYTRQILQSMAGLKRLNNVFIIPFGLGDKASEQTLNVPIKKSGSVGYGLSFIGTPNSDRHDLYKDQILITTIDKIVDCFNIQRIDFIKVDIEGFEYQLLQGARESIKRFKPTLFLEICDSALCRNNSSSKDIFEFLAPFGYKSYTVDSTINALIPFAFREDVMPVERDILFVAE